MPAVARLIVDVARLADGGERLQGELDPQALELDAATSEVMQPDGGIGYDLFVQTVGAELLARGSVRQRLHSLCVRCGCSFSLPVADEELVVALPLAETDVFVDLTPELREAIIIALPSHPLCRAACRGLCSRCGADLNQGPCSCRVDDEVRWGALDGLDG